MDNHGAPEGQWWLLVEEAPLDPDTPLLTFDNGQVFERRGGVITQTGRYRIGEDGHLHAEFPAKRAEDGPELLTVHLHQPADDFREAWSYADGDTTLGGSVDQEIEGYGLAMYCTLLREGPDLDELKAARAVEREQEEREREQEARPRASRLARGRGSPAQLPPGAPPRRR